MREFIFRSRFVPELGSNYIQADKEIRLVYDETQVDFSPWEGVDFFFWENAITDKEVAFWDWVESQPEGSIVVPEEESASPTLDLSW